MRSSSLYSAPRSTPTLLPRCLLPRSPSLPLSLSLYPFPPLSISPFRSLLTLSPPNPPPPTPSPSVPLPPFPLPLYWRSHSGHGRRRRRRGERLLRLSRQQQQTLTACPHSSGFSLPFGPLRFLSLPHPARFRSPSPSHQPLSLPIAWLPSSRTPFA